MLLLLPQCRFFLFIITVILLSITLCLTAENIQPSEDSSIHDPSCKAGRRITAEELARKTGKDGAEIWLSILGEVYDVSEGVEYYGDGAGYSFFTGRDASVTFVSGQFNEDGLKKSFDELEGGEVRGIESWRLFYSQHEKYKYVGFLVGELYNSEGKPTPVMNRLKEKLNASS